MARIRAQRGLMAEITRHIGVSTGAVPQWKRVPAEHVETVAEITGIPPHELRPDVFRVPKTETDAGGECW